MRFSILLSAVVFANSGVGQPIKSSDSNATTFHNTHHGSGTLRFATLNVMSANSAKENEDGYAPWNNRRLALVRSVHKEDADVIGFQDATAHQANAITGGLKPKYACHCISAGYGSMPQNVGCELAHQLINFADPQTTRWLVEVMTASLISPTRPFSTPRKSGSISWGARASRVAQLGQFKLISTGETFWVANAHFDDETQKAREESAKLLLDRVRDIVRGRETSYKPLVVLLGNLNVLPDDDAYHILTGNRYLTDDEDLRRIEPYTFLDLERSSGDDLSTITYKQRKREESYYYTKKISDYILAADNGAISKDCWRIGEVHEVSNKFNRKAERVSYSDHKMLVAEVTKD